MNPSNLVPAEFKKKFEPTNLGKISNRQIKFLPILIKMSKFVDHQIKFPPKFLPSRYPYRLHRVVRRNKQIVGNKAKGHISKRRWQENKARQIFRKINISYPLICTCMCAYQGVRNVCYSKNLACFLFLLLPSWYSSFCLITDETGSYSKSQVILRSLFGLLSTKQGHTTGHRHN